MTSNCLYEVEEILDKRTSPIKYLIKWKNYSIEDATWEPLKHLKGIYNLIEQFELKSKKQPVRKKARKNAYTKQKKAKHMYIQRDTNNYLFRKNIGKDHVPTSILHMECINDVIYCLLSFNKQLDGNVPINCYIEASQIADIYPALLIEFYESRLEFINIS